MQLHTGHKHHHTCSLHPDAATLRAAEIALQRAQSALRAGRLISPGEALALACGDARTKETLYSIARAVGFETDCDIDEIEARLAERFPDLAQ